MKNLTLSILFAVLTSSSLMAQWNKVRGNGNTVTENRSTGSYDAIAVSGFFDVTLVSGKEGDITLKGESNLLPYIVTEVKGGKLNIRVKKGTNISPSMGKGIALRVPIQDIDAVIMSGSGDIVGETTIQSDNFETRLSGSGDISLAVNARNVSAALSGSGDVSLKGKAESLEVAVSGSGDIDAYGLDAKHVKASISGSADVNVTARESLTARVSGSGDISYRGNPAKIDSKSSGSGDVSKG